MKATYKGLTAGQQNLENLLSATMVLRKFLLLRIMHSRLLVQSGDPVSWKIETLMKKTYLKLVHLKRSPKSDLYIIIFRRSPSAVCDCGDGRGAFLNCSDPSKESEVYCCSRMF